jgi:hypothetical protein
MKTKFIAAPEHTAPCGRVTILGITSGETDEIEFAGSPSVDAAKLGRFTVGVGWRLHRKLLPECPKIRYFRRDSLPLGAGARVGFADTAGCYVALRSDLEGRQLVETALHELRHLAQSGVRFTDGEAERDAEGFAHRWTPTTMRAYRATGGRLSRLAVTRSAKPSGWAPHMDIRLTLPTAEVGERDNRTMGDAWRELSCWNEA